MLLLWITSPHASGLRGSPDGSKAASPCAAAMGGSTNLSAIGEMQPVLLHATCSLWRNSSVLREPATARPPYKTHFRLQLWASRCEHPPHIWMTRQSDRA